MAAFQSLSLPVISNSKYHVSPICARHTAPRMSANAANLKSPNQPATQAKQKQNTITKREDDYAQWYLDVIASAELAESSPVRGCMIIKPHGYEMWELLRDELDRNIKATGVKNVYFPILIPQSFLTREAEHVEGFAKECALVTHHRLRSIPGQPGQLEPDPDAKLEEPLVVRPTSETIIWNSFGRWIQSYRDLPLLMNQWANVLRWEMRTRPFLRTSEFLWQEGHTAHSNPLEAKERAMQMILMYTRIAKEMLALPVVAGRKSPSERFAGADDTLTIEALMQNGWALQAGTSHYLGQNFAKAFDVTFKTAEGTSEFVWATSWGMTTRMIGAIIMTHSDDTGLVLPPSIAPIQVVLTLIFKSDEQRNRVIAFADGVAERLRCMNVRFEVDDRPNMRPGAKYYEWERKGVPLRMEIGPKDADKQAVFCAKRIGCAKQSVPVDDNFEEQTKNLLDEVQQTMFETAQERMQNRTFRVSSYQEMKTALEEGGTSCGLFLVPWKCDADNEKAIQEETKATLRCYPFEGQEECIGKPCFYSGEPATHMAIFARAY